MHYFQADFCERCDSVTDRVSIPELVRMLFFGVHIVRGFLPGHFYVRLGNSASVVKGGLKHRRDDSAARALEVRRK